jgi:hypothetical protein
MSKSYTASGLTICHIPRRSCTWLQGQRIVAIARLVTSHYWQLRIVGHQWPITKDMAIARFTKIPGTPMTHTAVTSFRTLKECCTEVERVLSTVEV